MSTSKEYKALKNWLHNTMKIDKGALVEIIDQCIERRMKQIAAEYFSSYSFERKIISALGGDCYDGLKSVLQENITKVVHDMMFEEFKKKFKFEVTIEKT